MTYCLGMNLDAGLVLVSDSRTNAGVDNVGRFEKMRVFAREGDRVVVTLSAGNLSVTQNVLSLIEQRARAGGEHSLWHAESLYDVACLLGDAMREVQRRDGDYLRKHNIEAAASFILAGQIRGEPTRMFLVYTEGNFIETSADTAFFQIGEIKYGKPIIDRVVHFDTPMTEVAKAFLVSFDSTMRSNLTVGLPIDLLAYERDARRVTLRRRFNHGDGYFSRISGAWSAGWRRAFGEVPDVPWVDEARVQS
jgi:putative proteasome-type protease